MYRNPRDRSSLSDRAMRVVTDPGRRVTLLIVVAYVTAALGLGVAFLGGVEEPHTGSATFGIVLLFVSFVSLFLVSVTVLHLEQGD